MMQIVTTRTFDELFNALDKKIQRKAAKKTAIFKQNPFNPTLFFPKCDSPNPGRDGMFIEPSSPLQVKRRRRDMSPLTRFIDER